MALDIRANLIGYMSLYQSSSMFYPMNAWEKLKFGRNNNIEHGRPMIIQSLDSG